MSGLTRKLILFTYYVLFIVLAVFSVVWLSKSLSYSWDNVDHWGLDRKISFPLLDNDLRVSKSISGPTGKTTFTFSADYCYLFVIQKSADGSEITLKCSLLPRYYFESSQNSPASWQQRSDITMVINNNDPAPDAFLGKSDRSFASISQQLEKPIAVSIQVVGEFQKPAKTLKSQFEHFANSISGSKTPVNAIITSYAIKRIDTATSQEQMVYANEWVAQLRKKFQTELAESIDKESSSTDRLNYLRKYFTATSLKCSKLESCAPEYEENPAEKVGYYLYGLQRYDATAFAKYSDLFYASLYPFNNKYPPQESNPKKAAKSPWTVFSAYNFPMCPIAEISKKEVNGTTKLFSAYAKVLSKYADTAEKSDALLKSYNRSLWFEADGWDSDFIRKFDGVCGNILSGAVPSTEKQRAKIVEVYLDMLSKQIGTTVTYDKKAIARLIYEKTAYSPYKPPFLVDSVLMTDRAKDIDTLEEQGTTYTEWKSLVNTLIIAYLYETL